MLHFNFFLSCPCLFSKLKSSKFKSIYFQFGKIVNEHYPLAEDGKTKGYTFLEFANHSSALEAVKATNNYKLDKQVEILIL